MKFNVDKYTITKSVNSVLVAPTTTFNITYE